MIVKFKKGQKKKWVVTEYKSLHALMTHIEKTKDMTIHAKIVLKMRVKALVVQTPLMKR